MQHSLLCWLDTICHHQRTDVPHRQQTHIPSYVRTERAEPSCGQEELLSWALAPKVVCRNTWKKEETIEDPTTRRAIVEEKVLYYYCDCNIQTFVVGIRRAVRACYHRWAEKAALG